MTEYMTDVWPSQGGALASFSMMGSQGEGSYASPTSTDVGLLQKDEVGLTRFAKTQPECKLPLDTCKITHQDFQNALQLLEPFLAEHEQRPPPFPSESINSTHRRYVAASRKRCKLTKSTHQPLPQKPPPAPVTWPESPIICLASLEPAMFHDGYQIHSDETSRNDTPELYFPASGDRTNGTPEMQTNIESASLTTPGKAESVEANNIRSGASEINPKTPYSRGEVFADASESSDQDKNKNDLNRHFHHDPHSDIYDDSFEQIKSASSANLYQRKGLWDPDLPINSVEKENEGLGIGYYRDNHKSRSLGLPESAKFGVRKGLYVSPYPTIAAVDNVAAQEAANETTGKLVSSHFSPGPSRKLSQASTLLSIAKLFLQSSLKTSSKSYFKALSLHQIPAELRQYFQALLRKYQTDQQFQKSVIIYAMEKTGAISPPKALRDRVPCRLREGFDGIRKRCNNDEKFKMSIDKYVTEYLKNAKNKEDPGALQCDKDVPEEPDAELENLSREKLIDYCRYLQKQERDLNGKLKRNAQRNSPKDLIPQQGSWTCYRPRTMGTSHQQIVDCGGKTPFYSAKCVWVANTNCPKCKAPYDGTLVSHKMQSGSKGQTFAQANEQINAQANEQANAQAYGQNYDAVSPPPGHLGGAQLNDFGAPPTVRGALSSDASTARTYGAVPENQSPGLLFPSPGQNFDNNRASQTPISGQSHPTLSLDTPWSLDDFQYDMDFDIEDWRFEEFDQEMGLPEFR